MDMNLPILLMWLTATFCLVAGNAHALTVRVDPDHGAPRLVVNGAAVRARMFWGGPGPALIPVGPVLKAANFEFIADESATNGTLHFRFGHKPGEVVLRDIKVTDLDEQQALAVGEWITWPPESRNTVGAVQMTNGVLNVRLEAPVDGQWPDFHIYHKDNLAIIKGHHYRVTFYARAEPARDLEVVLYRPGKPYVRLGGPPDVFESQIKLAASAGVDFISFNLGVPWPEPGQPVDWTSVDQMCERILKANPQARLLPRLNMNPPPWWCKANPEDVMQWDDGRRDNAVPASPRYRHDAAERLTALVTHLEEKFGDQIAGYHPSGQNTGEWFYESTWDQPLNGYAPADLVAWKEWLRAHNQPEVPVPTPAERRSKAVFADPLLVEWAQFQQEAMADCVCSLAHAVRQASGGNKLVVFFYGYLFEFGNVANGPATSGHYALRRVLDCPDIDVLCSPISYFDRGLGQGAPSMTAAESVALAGKMWLNEDDTHTYLATGTPPGSKDHVTTLADSNAELTRNVAQEALRNFGTWWMDLGHKGWFNDPGMWQQMRILNQLDDYFLKHPTPFRPEVAVVIDERSILHIAPGGVRLTRQDIFNIREPLGRMGAPYGQYLLDDVLSGRVSAKLYVLLNGWSLSPAERSQLLRATQNRKRIWCGVPESLAQDDGALYVATGGLTSAGLRTAAREAGVHLFTDTDCNVYANGNYLALHASQDGPLTIDIGAVGPVHDLMTDTVVGSGPKLTLPIKRGETRVLWH
jgi:hypothetical protein